LVVSLIRGHFGGDFVFHCEQPKVFVAEKQRIRGVTQITVGNCLEVANFFLLLHPASEEGKE